MHSTNWGALYSSHGGQTRLKEKGRRRDAGRGLQQPVDDDDDDLSFPVGELNEK